MKPTWVQSAPGGPHVGSMNLAIRVADLNRLLHNPLGNQLAVTQNHIDGNGSERPRPVH